MANDEKQETLEQSPPISVPKGGYNLDFLDNLDDPGFNPFETKTKVVNAFGASDNAEINKDAKDIAEDLNTNDVKEPVVKKRVATTSRKKILAKKKETESEANKEDKPEKPKKSYASKTMAYEKILEIEKHARIGKCFIKRK